ncbi:MAG TPA: hypothetical protein VFI29_03765 [Hanamia sp.]|nr:hypothetical protein [Hanamia sp.]
MLRKNFSPQQASMFTAIPISLLGSVAFYIYSGDFWPAIIFLFSLVLFVYFIIYFTIQRFIYRKIKLIYKLISQTKASKKEEFYFKNILPQKSIEEINECVEQWAAQHQEEVSGCQI